MSKNMISTALNHHRQALKLVLGRMRQNALSTLMISLVIAAALCVPGLFYLGVNHISSFANHIQDENEISVFLKLDADSSAIANVKDALNKNEAVQSVKFVSKDEAWQQLRDKAEKDSASSNVINELKTNPLPDAFLVLAKSSKPEDLEALKDELKALAHVDQALLNTEWVKRLSALLALGKQIIIIVAGLLAAALLIIISNTVRMQILTQKDEIIVSKLIGATNSFIRKPFLYAGMLYGLFGGLLAIVMLVGFIMIFNQTLAQLSALYNSDFSLALINLPLFAGMVCAAIAIGWLGSYVAVTRAAATININ